MAKTIDIRVAREGNLFVCTVNTEAARAWVEENVELESWAWLGRNRFVVDQHYIESLVVGMEDAGLVVT